MKFPEKEIIDAVKRVLEEGRSIQESARSIGMSRTRLKEYVYRAKEHGYNCLFKSSSNRKFDGEFKVYVVEYIKENNLSSWSAAAHFNLDRSTVRSWLRIYLEKGSEALYERHRGKNRMNPKKREQPTKLEKQTEEDLIVENQRLRMENEFLKKLNALVLEREKREKKK